MSDSSYYSSKDALRDRYLRKVELLIALARRPDVTWKMVAAWLSDQDNTLNSGQSLRAMKAYLQEWALGGYGFFKNEQFILEEKGLAKAKEESTNMARWLRPLDWEKMDRFITGEIGPPKSNGHKIGSPG